MNKKYIEPEVDIVSLLDTDIVVASGNTTPNQMWPNSDPANTNGDGINFPGSGSLPFTPKGSN